LVAEGDLDSDRFRATIAAAGTEAVIPSIRSRSQAIPYDKHVYGDRNVVERFFNKIKHFCRIATRYEKTALVCIHAIPRRRHDLAPMNVNRP